MRDKWRAAETSWAFGKLALYCVSSQRREDVTVEPMHDALTIPEHSAINWVIIGGKSGDNDSPFHLEHAEFLIQQCQQHGIKVFVKQMGSLPVMSKQHWMSLDEQDRPALSRNNQPYAPAGTVALKFTGKGEILAEFPPGLRVREFPCW